MSRRIQDFPTAVSVSTSDLLLIAQNGLTKNTPVALLQTALVPPSYLSSLSDVSVGGAVSGQVLQYDGSIWVAVSVDFVDATSIQNQFISVQNQITSLDSRVTSVANNLSFNLVSLNDVSLATSAGSNDFVVTWNQTKNQFVLNSVGSTFDLASVDARVTSVESHVNTVSNQVSVVNARATSIQSGLVSVDGRVTSVENHVNVVSNQVSVVNSRITSVNNDITNISAALVSFNNRSTSINTRIDTVSANVTSVYNLVSNTTSALNDRITSVANNLTFNLVSLSDVSLATSAGADNYAVTWDAVKNQFVLSSVGGGGSVSVVPLSISVSTFVGDNTFTTITVDHNIDDKNKGFLFIKGIYQNKNTYSVSGTEITLTSTLPNLASAEWVYLGGGSAVGGGGGAVTTVQYQELLNSIAANSAAISSVDARVTSVNNYFLNDSSVVNARVTSVNNTLRGDITSVYNFASNGLSVAQAGRTSLSNRIDTVSSQLTTTSAALRGDITSARNQVSGAITALSATLRSDITSVYNFCSNQASVQGARSTSLRTDITSVFNQLTSVSAVLRIDITSVHNEVSNLSMDFIAGMIPVVSIQRYDLDRRAFRKYIIRSVFVATSTGECTYSLRRNGTNLTGFTSVVGSVNTSVVTSGTLVTIEVGDRFDLNITTNTSAVDYAFNIGIQKVF